MLSQILAAAGFTIWRSASGGRSYYN